MQTNLILEGVLDAYLKTHNFSVFYPVLRLVCGDMADDATTMVEEEEGIIQTLIHTAAEALLHR